MSKEHKCIIWGTSLRSKKGMQETHPLKWEYDSPRAGGKYIIDEKMRLASKNNLSVKGWDNKTRRQLSGYIAKESLNSRIPDFSKEKLLENLPPIPNPSERAYLLLEGLVRETDDIGKTFDYDLFVSDSIRTHFISNPYIIFYPLSYCNTVQEMEYLLNYLKEMKFIKVTQRSDGCSNFEVTIKGFEKSASNKNLKTAFIAMWFDSSVDDLKESIKEAVENTGYEVPQRMDEKEHINKIDDQILVEINKSRFMICDLTSEGGDRGNVYFEAGYAIGKNIPVIWTCNKSKKKMAFDIRQYNCLFWEKSKMKEFRERLQHRIENVIGEGPFKGNSKK